MKILGVALVMAVTLGTVMFLVLWGIGGLDEHVAVEVGAIPVVGVPHVADMLEKWQGKNALARGEEAIIRPIHKFYISFPALIIVSTFIIMAMMQISSGIVGAVIGIVLAASGNETPEINEGILTAIGIGSLPFMMAGSFILGRWIGARCGNHAVLKFILSMLLGVFASKLLDYELLPSKTLGMIWQDFGTTAFDIGMLIALVLLIVPGLVGIWRGQKHKLTNYMRYLMFMLPEDTRNLLVELAFDEAKKATVPRSHAQSVHATA